MKLKDWFNQLMDFTIVFSFDNSGFKRHCSHQLQMVDLSGRHGIVTGASSGIGLAVAKGIFQQKMVVQLIGRDLDELKRNFQFDQYYPNGKFWFDRKQAETTILNLNKTDSKMKKKCYGNTVTRSLIR